MSCLFSHYNYLIFVSRVDGFFGFVFYVLSCTKFECWHMKKSLSQISGLHEWVNKDQQEPSDTSSFIARMNCKLARSQLVQIQMWLVRCCKRKIETVNRKSWKILPRTKLKAFIRRFEHIRVLNSNVCCYSAWMESSSQQRQYTFYINWNLKLRHVCSRQERRR